MLSNIIHALRRSCIALVLFLQAFNRISVLFLQAFNRISDLEDVELPAELQYLSLVRARTVTNSFMVIFIIVAFKCIYTRKDLRPLGPYAFTLTNSYVFTHTLHATVSGLHNTPSEHTPYFVTEPFLFHIRITLHIRRRTLSTPSSRSISL